MIPSKKKNLNRNLISIYYLTYIFFLFMSSGLLLGESIISLCSWFSLTLSTISKNILLLRNLRPPSDEN